MDRDVRLDSHHPGSRHATKARRWGMGVETGRWAGMDKGKDRDKVGVESVDNKGKDNPLVAGMEQNQAHMPCYMPPMTLIDDISLCRDVIR